MSGKDIEIKVMDALVARLGRERCRVWFGDRTRLEVVAGNVMIRSYDSFILDRLRNRFRGDIAAAAEGVFGVRTELLFELMNPTEGSIPAPTNTIHRSKEMDSSSTSNAIAATPPGTDAKLPRRVYHTFEDFIVGNGNRLAYTAAQSVLPRWGQVSPLTIVGPSGCGKTHLLEGIWREAKDSGRLRRVVSLSAEQFLTQFLDALQGAGLPSFRRKYRDLDLLIIDDLHFLAGKRNTAIELQHTVDQLLRDRKQIVFSCDRLPEELPGLGDDLAARLRGGLVVSMTLADEATRRGILAKQAATKSCPIPAAALDWMAASLPGDARALSGAVNRLVAAHEVLGEEITLDFAAQTLQDLVRASCPQVSPHDVVHVVCEAFGLEKESLLSSGKSSQISQPRMLAMWLMRKLTRASLSEIGKSLGRKSHTTVLSAETKVSQWMSAGKKVRLAQGECAVSDALLRIEARLKRA